MYVQHILFLVALLQKESYTYMEPGAIEGFRLMLPFDNFFVQPSTTLGRLSDHVETFKDFLSRNFVIDINRGINQARSSRAKSGLMAYGANTGLANAGEWVGQRGLEFTGC